jgi:hypothetical protein
MKLIMAFLMAVVAVAAMPFAVGRLSDGAICVQIDGRSIIGDCRNCENNSTGPVSLQVNVCS